MGVFKTGGRLSTGGRCSGPNWQWCWFAWGHWLDPAWVVPPVWWLWGLHCAIVQDFWWASPGQLVLAHCWRRTCHHLMSPWSLSSRCLVQAFVVIIVVMSSMYTLIWMKRLPILQAFAFSHLWWWWAPLPWQMPGRTGKAWHYAFLSMLPGDGCPVLWCRTGDPGSKLPQLCDTLWDLEEAESCPKTAFWAIFGSSQCFLGQCPKSIGKIQNYMQVLLAVCIWYMQVPDILRNHVSLRSALMCR